MRATLICSTIIPPWPRGPGNLVNAHLDRDIFFQLLILSKEFLVNSVHQPALITSLPFVHTARQTYRVNGPVRPRCCGLVASSVPGRENLYKPYHFEEGEFLTRFLSVNLWNDHYLTIDPRSWQTCEPDDNETAERPSNGKFVWKGTVGGLRTCRPDTRLWN